MLLLFWLLECSARMKGHWSPETMEKKFSFDAVMRDVVILVLCIV